MSHHYHLDSDYFEDIDFSILYFTDNGVFSLSLCSDLTGNRDLYRYKGEEAKKNFELFIKNVDREETVRNRRYLTYKKNFFDLHYPEMSRRIDWEYLDYNIGKTNEELVVKLRCFHDNYFRIVNKI